MDEGGGRGRERRPGEGGREGGEEEEEKRGKKSEKGGIGFERMDGWIGGGRSGNLNSDRTDGLSAVHG